MLLNKILTLPKTAEEWKTLSDTQARQTLENTSAERRTEIQAQIESNKDALDEGKVLFVGFVPLKNEAQGHMYRARGYDAIREDWHEARVHFYAVIKDPKTGGYDAVTAYNAPPTEADKTVRLTFPTADSGDTIRLRDVDSPFNEDSIILHQTTCFVCDEDGITAEKLSTEMANLRSEIEKTPPAYANISEEEGGKGVGCQTLMRVLFERTFPELDLAPIMKELDITVTTFHNTYK